ILMMTRRAASAPSAARLMCPACKLPIVGANAIVSPATRQAATAARTSLTVCATRRAFVTTRFTSLGERVFRGRIAAVLDGAHIGTQSLERRIAPRQKVFHEARHATLRDAENVVKHEDLTVDARTGTDADHWDLHRVANGGAESVRHAFQQQRIGP